MKKTIPWDALLEIGGNNGSHSLMNLESVYDIFIHVASEGSKQHEMVSNRADP